MNHIKKTHLMLCIHAFLIIHYTYGSILKINTIKVKNNKAGVLSNAWPKMKNYDIWDSPNKSNKNSFRDKNNSHSNSSDSSTTIITTAKWSENKRSNNHLRNGKVLNFFPISEDDECLSSDGRRSGICLNTYECRIQGGSSSGGCAFGFGVCCIFTATCDQEVFNNITYIVSPSFPGLMPPSMTSCKLKIRMIDPDISQLRLDFQHFSLGQPNRRTGICDGDFFMLTGGKSTDFVLCGQNSGQHMYYDVSGMARADGVDLIFNLSNKLFERRLWEIRVAQMSFSQKTPTGCLQYYSGVSGIIQTFNFAENGRHLANQDYRACVRQESGMCSIAYEPCDDQSFRIGVPGMNNNGGTNGGFPNFGSGQPGFGGPSFSNPSGTTGGNLNGIGSPLADAGTVSDSEAVAADPASDGNADIAADDAVEGSGDDDGGFFGFRLPSLFSFRSFNEDNIKQRRRSRQFFPTCTDRITLPCIIEDFIGIGMGNVPGCEPIHCGNNLCSAGLSPCRIETSVTPFGLGIHFGDGVDKGSPEDNIGACLRYNQVACA